MKIQLDTTAKTIKVEENVNLSEFVKAIQKLLPDGLWKEFTLETNAVINWVSYPIITYPIWYAEPSVPWLVSSETTTCNADIPYTLTSGTYNVEVTL